MSPSQSHLKPLEYELSGRRLAKYWKFIGFGVQGEWDLWPLIHVCAFKTGILRIKVSFSLSLVNKVGTEISK